MQLQPLLDKVIQLSLEVAEWIAEQRVSAKDIELKSLNNLVSYVDKQAEQKFVSGLSELLPEAGFIAEEGTGTANRIGYNWIIDPLDGTTNYLHGVPMWCTSAALIKDGILQLGVICDPNRNEVYSALTGGGAFRNGDRISCSEATHLTQSLLGTGFPYDDFGRQKAYMELLTYLTRNTRGIRRPGSAALDLAYVACGRFDGFYEYALNPWDVAAGILLVREAGGVVSGFSKNGDPIFGDDLIASNKFIYHELQEIISNMMD